jgi:hypothetical protein
MVEDSERRSFWMRQRVLCWGTTLLLLWMILGIGWWRSNHSNPFSYVKQLCGRTAGMVLKQFVKPGMSQADCEMILGETSSSFTCVAICLGPSGPIDKRTSTLLDFHPPFIPMNYDSYGFTVIIDPKTKCVLGIVDND